MTVLIPEVAESAEGAGAAAGGAARRRAGQAAQAYGSQAAYVGRSARVIPGDRSYQPVILAEFLIAVVIVAAVPIASGGSPAAQAKNSPSPYDTGDLRQLVAVGAVYFILSLVSSGNRGRIAAWLGGLVVIGLGLSKVSQGTLSSVFTAMTGVTGSSGTADSTGST